MALVVCRRHQELQRHFEGLGHFEAVQRQRERRLDQRDHRRDDEGGDGGIGRQLADHLDMAWPKADFFFGLAQRSGGGVLVVRLRASAGEADLPRVVAQMIGALREQHVHVIAAVDQRHQHRGMCGLAAAQRAAIAGHLRLPGGRRREALAQRGRRQTPGVDSGEVCVGADHGHGVRIEDAGTGHWRQLKAGKAKAARRRLCG